MTEITLWELVLWAYRIQKVGDTLSEVVDDSASLYWPKRSGDGCSVVARVASVGTEIDGGKHIALNTRMHDDATVVSTIIDRLPDGLGNLVIWYATLGECPMPDLRTPRPVATPPGKDDDWEWSDEDYRRAPGGRQFRIKRKNLGFVREAVQQFIQKRRKMVKNGTRLGPRIPVFAYPISYDPPIHEVNFANRDADRFLKAMDLLSAGLAGMLGKHRVIGMGLPFQRQEVPGQIAVGTESARRVELDFGIGGTAYWDELAMTYRPYVRRVRAKIVVDGPENRR